MITPSAMSDDILDKSVAFLAKRDGIDKVGKPSGHQGKQFQSWTCFLTLLCPCRCRCSR